MQEENINMEKRGKNLILKQNNTSQSLSLSCAEIVETWRDGCYLFSSPQSQEQKGLRMPQLGAVYAVLSHWTISKEIATVVIPTGVGKTEAMLSLLISDSSKRLLVTVPSEALRKQLSGKFVKLGLLEELGLIDKTKVETPKVGVFTESFQSDQELIDFIKECNVIVTTVQLLAKQPDSLLEEISKLFSHYFIDEAHHTPAKTWSKIRDYIKIANAKIVQFTATPFREDGKRIDGKVVYNFPLKKAQEQGFFSPILFVPIKALTIRKADRLIAEKAVFTIKQRFNSGFTSQIIMARVSDKKRAADVVHIYEEIAPDLHPIVIHTGLENDEIASNTRLLKEGGTHIVVCVDMFGEGFDEPNFKIAALHDPKRGLAVTLQFIGRFTRVGGGNLGPATFIANVFDNDFKAAIAQLYNEDSDWNQIISTISEDAIDEEIKFSELANSFSGDNSAKQISIESLNPAYSTAIYKNSNRQWNPILSQKDFHLDEQDSLNVLTSDDNNIIVAIVTRSQQAQWTTSSMCDETRHELFIFFNDTENNLLFINSSENEGYYKELAQKLLDDPNPSKIDGEDCFKVFQGIKRLILNNVGLKQFIGRNVRYRMSIGSDVSDAISLLEKQNSTKSLIAGSGYKNGSKDSIGVSCKGRIWSVRRGNINNQISWFKEIGKLLTDPAISSKDVLKHTLVATEITELPNEDIFAVDWDETIYDYKTETSASIIYADQRIPVLYTSMAITKVDTTTQQITFCISSTETDEPATSKDYKAECTLRLTSNSEGHAIPEYTVNYESTPAIIQLGKRRLSLEEFLQEHEPTFSFVDGSHLTGTKYINAQTEFGLYNPDKIITKKWDNINLSKESMWKNGILRTDSIQYAIVEELKTSSKYSVIINDDGAGEIADIIAISPPSETSGNESISIELYHLKYATEGKPSSQIKNLYEVCGQAQKSSRWKLKCDNDAWILFRHIQHREERFQEVHPESTRIVYGDIDEILKLKRYSKSLKYKFKIIIVQPGIDSKNITNEMRAVLACTESYLDEVACIPLEIIGS